MIRIDPARLGATYAVLMAAHDGGDHVLQTDEWAGNKATSWAAMAGHVGSYTALQVAALEALHALTGTRPSWRRTLAAVAWSAGTHAFLDRRWPVKKILELTGSANFAQPRIPPLAVRTRNEQINVKLSRVVMSTEEAPLPIHGPYLADQALHHACLLVAAIILAATPKGSRG
jgi:hypothetical protein